MKKIIFKIFLRWKLVVSNKLAEICTQFSSIAFSYGFNLDEVVQELMKLKRKTKSKRLIRTVV